MEREVDGEGDGWIDRDDGKGIEVASYILILIFILV